MVDVLALSLGILFTLVAVVLHFSKGTQWTAADDISQEIMERRAETVPETDFPEPMNRAIGAGGGGAVAAGGEAGELEDGEGDGEAAEEESGPGDIPEDEIEHYEIEFAKEGETIEVANDTTLLNAGEDEGWDLPYSCRQGQCVSCGGKVDGDAHELVEHDDQEMLDDNELDDGYVLTCVAYPRDSFTLETNEKP